MIKEKPEPKTRHYDLDYNKKYVIRLPIVGVDEYFCYPSTKYHKRLAVVYSPNDPRMENDLALCGGVPVEVTGSVAHTIFNSGRYSNQQPSPEQLFEEYKLCIQNMSKLEDERQGQLL